MGRDTLKQMLHHYYWGRTDMANWTDKDDARLIEQVLAAQKTKEIEEDIRACMDRIFD